MLRQASASDVQPRRHLPLCPRTRRRELRWSGLKGTYRQAFAISLRAVYSAEREAIAEAAYQATLPPVPADVADRARRLSAAAWGCRIDGSGNAMFSLLAMQARDLVDAARGFL